MAIQSVGSYPILQSFLRANPVQAVGILSITMLATNALSNLPMAQAAAATPLCDIICEPLPGGKEDIPERLCTKTCEQGGEIIKTTTKEAMKDGKWKAVEVLGKVATPIAGYFDCKAICNPITGIARVFGDIGTSAWKFFKADTMGACVDIGKAATKAGCMALLTTPGGEPACLICCGGTKVIGVG